MSEVLPSKTVSCETQGHMWGPGGKCVFCPAYKEEPVGPPPCDHDAYTPCPPACKEAKDQWRRDAAREISAAQQASTSQFDGVLRLVEEHANDWVQSAVANSSPFYDPNAEYYTKQARETTDRLKAAIRRLAAETAPASKGRLLTLEKTVRHFAETNIDKRSDETVAELFEAADYLKRAAVETTGRCPEHVWFEGHCVHCYEPAPGNPRAAEKTVETEARPDEYARRIEDHLIALGDVVSPEEGRRARSTIDAERSCFGFWPGEWRGAPEKTCTWTRLEDDPKAFELRPVRYLVSCDGTEARGMQPILPSHCLNCHARVVSGPAEKTTVETKGNVQAPIAELDVAKNGYVSAKLYAPGLPPGKHDVYCMPPAARPEDQFTHGDAHPIDMVRAGFDPITGQPLKTEAK